MCHKYLHVFFVSFIIAHEKKRKRNIKEYLPTGSFIGGGEGTRGTEGQNQKLDKINGIWLFWGSGVRWVICFLCLKLCDLW